MIRIRSKQPFRIRVFVTRGGQTVNLANKYVTLSISGPVRQMQPVGTDNLCTHLEAVFDEGLSVCGTYSVTCEYSDGDERVIADSPMCIRITERSSDSDMPECGMMDVPLRIDVETDHRSHYDYNTLSNKPRIGGHELIGDLSPDELGLQQEGDYVRRTEMPDWSRFVEKIDGKGLSTHDFTDEDKRRLDTAVEDIEGLVVNGGAYPRLDEWARWDEGKSTWVLSARLGVELRSLIESVRTSVSSSNIRVVPVGDLDGMTNTYDDGGFYMVSIGSGDERVMGVLLQTQDYGVNYLYQFLLSSFDMEHIENLAMGSEERLWTRRYDVRAGSWSEWKDRFEQVEYVKDLGIEPDFDSVTDQGIYTYHENEQSDSDGCGYWYVNVTKRVNMTEMSGLGDNQRMVVRTYSRQVRTGVDETGRSVSLSRTGVTEDYGVTWTWGHWREERVGKAYAFGPDSYGGEVFNDYGHNVADGEYSHAEGLQTTASGMASHAEGCLTKATNNYAHAEGSSTLAVGENAHAEGCKTEAGGNCHAEGYDTCATGGYCHSEGYGTKATATRCHAEGSLTTASGYGSHAEGGSTTAGGKYAHAEGASTKANGENSHAEGGGSKANGLCSHAEGSSSAGDGDCSHAEGFGTKAKGNYSHAEGYITEALNTCEHACGMFNASRKSNDDAEATLWSVGNGTSGTDRKNAAELKRNGDFYACGDLYSGGKNLSASVATLESKQPVRVLNGLRSLTNDSSVDDLKAVFGVDGDVDELASVIREVLGGNERIYDRADEMGYASLAPVETGRVLTYDKAVLRVRGNDGLVTKVELYISAGTVAGVSNYYEFPASTFAYKDLNMPMSIGLGSAMNDRLTKAEADISGNGQRIDEVESDLDFRVGKLEELPHPGETVWECPEGVTALDQLAVGDDVRASMGMPGNYSFNDLADALRGRTMVRVNDPGGAMFGRYLLTIQDQSEEMGRIILRGDVMDVDFAVEKRMFVMIHGENDDEGGIPVVERISIG